MRGSRWGFTIIEVMVVLAILAVIMGVTLPAFRQWLHEDDMTAATHRLEALFQMARDSAIHSGFPITVVIDSVSGRVWLDAPPPDIDPDTLAPAQTGTTLGNSMAFRTLGSSSRDTTGIENGEPLDLPASIRLELTRARAQFTFTPGGAAFADSLTLRSSMEARVLTLNPWTGDVQVF